jgi:putative transposase
LIELNVQPDHVHLVESVPPKLAISTLMGVLKGKLAIKLFTSYPQLKKKPYWGNHFWARGYFVNTVGINEDHIRWYVKYQENEARKEESNSQGFDLFDPPI